jgi:hypothetical protein
LVKLLSTGMETSVGGDVCAHGVKECVCVCGGGEAVPIGISILMTRETHRMQEDTVLKIVYTQVLRVKEGDIQRTRDR